MSEPVVLPAEIVAHEDVPNPGPAPMPGGFALQPAVPATLFGSGSPAETIAKATEHAKVLKDILVDRGHIVRIGQSDHVKLEGWTTLGSQVGVFAIVDDDKLERYGPEPPELAHGYKAFAVAKTLAGQIVGAASAVCMRAERNWAERDDYALLSMAQTRACSKALRMPLGFIIELAGYNPTPADEMPTGTISQAGKHSDGASSPRRPSERSGGDSDHTPPGTPSGGPPPLPPLLMTEADRLEDGGFPQICPYCLGAIRERTVRIKKGTDDERDATVVDCTVTWCQGGNLMRGDQMRFGWSTFGSIEHSFEAGGRIDELVNAGGQTSENIVDSTPDFDRAAYFERLESEVGEWSKVEWLKALTTAKREVAHGKRWSAEVAKDVAAEAMRVYYEQHPDDDSRPF